MRTSRAAGTTLFPPRASRGRLVHRIEQGRLDALPGAKSVYSSWQELHAGLENLLAGSERIAMQYSPNNDIMYVSMVDAGTVEFVRAEQRNGVLPVHIGQP